MVKKIVCCLIENILLEGAHLHTHGGWATGPVCAFGTAVLFVDGFVLNAGLLVSLTWVLASGCVLPGTIARGIYEWPFSVEIF